MTRSDPLLACLAWLTGHYGTTKSPEALKAGLPYDESGMGPALFCEAARRTGFEAAVVEKKQFSDIPQSVLPAVLILKDTQACILLPGATGKTAQIFSPETGAVRSVDIKTLVSDYAGYAIYVHPRTEFTDPATYNPEEFGAHWFWSPFLANMPLYLRVLVTAFFINLFGLASPVFIMNVYDRVLPNNALDTGWVLAIGALTVFVFDFIMRTLRGYFIDLAGRKTDVIAARKIYDQVLDMQLSGRPPSSGAFANMLRDFDSVRDFLMSATVTAIVDLPFSLLFLTVIYLIGGPIAFVLAGLMLLAIIVGLCLQWPLRMLVRKSSKSAEARHGLLVETIHTLETIKAIGADGRMRARYGRYVGENAAWGQGSRFISALGINIAAFLQQSSGILVVLTGMYLIQDSHITVGGIIACVILGGRAIAPVSQIAALMTRYHQATSAYRTLNDLMRKPVERPAHRKFLHRPDLKGRITFDRVSFSYPSTDRKVLDRVSFDIREGEKVAIIGRIGSGKSTLSRLMMGLYEPAEGTILADGTDYRQIDPADLRRNIACIAQDVVLFSGSVRDNIVASCPHASEEDILAVSKASGVHDFIARHPMGYDAPVGERGEGLSGGQRQAVALARAMLLNPRVLVCDEPTNAMDIQAEDAFCKHIRTQAKDRTLILITHRHSLLSLTDRIIVIDQGKILMDGERETVLKAISTGAKQA